MSYAAATSTQARFGFGPIAETVRFDARGKASPDKVAESSAAEAISQAELDLRQLRHHTKNTLQQIIGLLGETRELLETPEGEALVQELEHRIVLSAAISNALFGLTKAPAPM